MPPVRRIAAAAALAGCAAAAPALAETELSFYMGAQDAPHSRVTGSDPGGVGDFSFSADWLGKSFDMPPYYGVRATWWRTERLGFGIEINHAKVYASEATKAASGFSVLEMTDGLNIVTANVMYRWPQEGRRWTPYVGGGLGVAVPHVEVTSAGGSVFEYQLTGPAAAAIAGVSYSLGEKWAVFGEYKATYSMNKMDLGSGGTMETNIVTNAVNLGVAFRF
jgi:lipid A oxidase